jgi:hypothetical protein
MEIIILKKAGALSTEEKIAVFRSALPLPDSILLDIRIGIFSNNINDKDGDFTVECNYTGYSMLITSDYQVQLSSNVHPVKQINILSIIECLLDLGAIMIK